jgi:hypothetical protein
MKLECKDREYALREGSPELLEAIAAHAEDCPACREQLRRWSEISRAAGALSRQWESPQLWPRIQQALAGEVPGHSARIYRLLAMNSQLLAAAAVILLTVSVVWVVLRNHQSPMPPDPESEKRLLTEKALREIETNEAAYIQSIDKLSRLVEPRIENAGSPIMLSYREKLALINAAIAECRSDVERNRFNAHLRKELVSMYEEKQRTLEEVMRIDKNDIQ